MIEKIIITVEKSTRKTNFNKNFIGNDLENLQQELVFKFTDEFVEGSARLEYRIGNEKHHIPMTKDGESYIVPVKNVITKEGEIPMQIVVVQAEQSEEIPVFKSNVFKMYCGKSINAQTEAPDDYEYWLDVIQTKLASIDEALAEVDNLNITAERVSDGVEISITDKEGETTTTKVNDGENGQDGIDGFSPIANVSKTGKTATITITDKIGTTTSTISDGNDGADGQDGYSPSATVTSIQNGARIDITDKDGTTTANVYNGDDYVITQQDYNTIANIVETDIAPVLNNKADKSTIPTKTSDLTNDSNFAKTNQNNNFTTAQTIDGTLTVNGDIVQSGQSYETHAEQLYTKKDIIKTRDGAIGGLASNEVTGIEAINYDGTNNGRLVFDNTGTARVGDVGDEVPLCGRDESSNMTDGKILTWDGTNLIAKSTIGMVTLTQDQYDALVLAGTVDSATYYYIVEA